ncbi:MAG: hypothetical protein SVY10_20335 [Thermodesulfobacteriota bacterium]|nr:hypothetical protein [Thermodesulfobacteriota bacterium]
MIDTAIVGLIDILGYESLVKRHMENIEVIRGIERLLKQSTVGIMEKLKGITISEIYENPIIEDYYNKVVDAISIRFISDTILFSLQFSKIRFYPSVCSREETISHCIHLYLALVSNFCTLFIAKTGLLLRGGISIGSHYESESNRQENNFFVFSRAYLNAYRLERAAKNPRILVDDTFWSYLKEISFHNSEFYFYRDKDKRNCFDFYCFLRHDTHSQSVLTDIRKGVLDQLKIDKDDNESLEKSIYFVEYHNRKVSRDELAFPELAIDIEKFKRQEMDGA